MDSDREPPQAFMTALVTEHFVLQGARSTLTSEIASRAALYLAALTGSLIALGFVARDASILGPFATAVIPALWILGEFTYWRLVQGGVEDLHHSWEMQRIRAYYRHLVPPGLPFFAEAIAPESVGPERRFMGVTARALNVFLTASSMIGAINSMLAGAGVALAAHAAANVSAGAAIGLAVVVAVVLYLAHARLAIHRYNVGLADLRVPPKAP
jgi:hypothetical protein